MFILFLLIVVALMVFALDWINWKDLLKPLKNCKGVKLVAPNLSFEASGTIGKIITYAKVRGIKYARSWFKPANPQTSEQVNMRTAVALMVAYWQTPLAAPTVAAYKSGASGTKDTGFSLYMGRGLDAYIAQITVAVTPVSVVVANVYPDDVFTWT